MLRCPAKACEKENWVILVNRCFCELTSGLGQAECQCEFQQLYTFGCNDEGALGRDTSEEGTETEPALVEGLDTIVQVSAGDSHTAVLTEDGRVFAFGNFRVGCYIVCVYVLFLLLLLFHVVWWI